MKDDFDFVCPTKIYFRENRFLGFSTRKFRIKK